MNTTTTPFVGMEYRDSIGWKSRSWLPEALSGTPLALLAECVEIQAEQLSQWADELEQDALYAERRHADDADEYRQRAIIKREEAEQVQMLYKMMHSARAINIQY